MPHTLRNAYDETAMVERRYDHRLPATGAVMLRIDKAEERTILHGEMEDVSFGGFRVRYLGKPLQTGLELAVSHLWGDAKAKVMWVRAMNEWCEVGLLIRP